MHKELLEKLLCAVDYYCTYKTPYMLEELRRIREEVREELVKKDKEVHCER
jgi:hypothetical protein